MKIIPHLHLNSHFAFCQAELFNSMYVVLIYKHFSVLEAQDFASLTLRKTSLPEVLPYQ